MKNKIIYDFARSTYCGPRSEQAFYHDISLIKLIQKQLTRYQKKKCLNYRLLLNNIILFFNVFNVQSAKTILFNTIPTEFHTVLKTFLFFLNFLTDEECVGLKLDHTILIILKDFTK